METLISKASRVLNSVKKETMEKAMWFIAGTVIGMAVVGLVDSHTMKTYDDYYLNTERLLNQLDSAYDWVDAFDPDYYYESVVKVADMRGE